MSAPSPLVRALQQLTVYDDARVLVRALIACARRQLTAASRVDPRNEELVLTAERWLDGTCTLAEVQACVPPAEHIPGGYFAIAPIKYVVASPEERPAILQRFAQLATSVWAESLSGRAWSVSHDATTPFVSDPDAAAAIAEVERRLAALALREGLGEYARSKP